MTLAIGLLLSNSFPVPAKFLLSFIELYTHLLTGQSPFTSVRLIRSEGFPIDAARNDIVREFLRSPAEHLLFLDADMTFPPDLPSRLVAHGVPVVTARYHMRKPPFRCVGMVAHPSAGPGEFQSVHYGAGLIDIARGGAGALLIHRAVLEGIRDRIGEAWFRYQPNPKHPARELTTSEDFWFYEQAQAAGFVTWMDWDTCCGHLAQIEVGHDAAMGALEIQRQQVMAQSPEAQRAVLDRMVVINRPHPWIGDARGCLKPSFPNCGCPKCRETNKVVDFMGDAAPEVRQ